MPVSSDRKRTLRLALRRCGVAKIGLDVALEALRARAPLQHGRTGPLRGHLPRAARDAALPRVPRRMTSPRDGLARSVQVRLARHAKAVGLDPNMVLTRYAVERFLYRLSR